MPLKRYILIALSMILFLHTNIYAKEMTQEERNKIAAQLIPIITMLLMDDTPVVTPEQTLIIEKIKAYAEESSIEEPLLEDYLQLGLKNVNRQNLSKLNQKIASLHAVDVGSIAKLQVLVDILNDTEAPVITLIGDKTVTLTVGQKYIDAGATVSDNYYKNIKATKKGKVDTTKVGKYIIVYSAVDGSSNKAISVKRIVIVKKKVITPPTTIPGPVVDGIDNATLTLVANCAACHGMDKPIGVNEIPVIQGLGKAYLSRVLNGYKIAQHHSYVMNRIMDGYSATDIDKMATYYTRQTWQGQELDMPNESLLQTGADLYDTNCVVCHQEDGVGVGAPAKGIVLKGQNERYLQNTLMHYAKGLHSDAHAAMKSIFKDDIGIDNKKINALSHYLANGLKVDTIPISDDTQKPVITLKGSKRLLIKKGQVFVDPGYTVSDNVDTVFDVKVTGDIVDTQKVGTYYRYYDVTDRANNHAKRQTRIIEVKNNIIDKTKPDIVLEGEKTITLLQYDRYIEPGYIATDNVDGEVTVVVNGDVDRTKIGVYTITYSAEDSSKNRAKVKRVITVRARKVYTTYPDGLGTYRVGTEVLGSTGKIYRCKVAGWCNQDHIAYYPGTGFGWTDAWDEVGNPDPQTPAVDAPPATPVLLSAVYNYGTKQIDATWKALSANTQKVDIIVDGKVLNTVVGSKKTSGSTSGVFKLDTTYYVSLNAINETGSELSNEITLDIRNRTDKGKILYNENCKVCHGANGTNKKDLTLWDESSSFAQWTHDSDMPNGYLNGLNNSELNLIGIYVKEILIPRSHVAPTTTAEDVNGTTKRGYRLLNSVEYRNTLYSLFNVIATQERENKLGLDLASMPLDNLVSGYNSDRNMNRVDEDKVKFFNQVSHSYEQYIDRLKGGSGTKCMINGYDFCKANKNTFLNNFAIKIYRRPLTQVEKTQYLKSTSIGQILGDMLVSPHFLYRSEMGKRVGDTDVYKLTQYEIATAIAYAMSGTTPDDRLLNLARAKKLNSVNTRTTEAVRLFGTKTGKERLDDFIGRWLLSDDYYNLADKNPKRFPGYTDTVKKAQSEQILKFFRMVLEDPEKSTYSDLFINTKWMTKKVLSDFYKEGTSVSGEFEEISATSKRYGMLTLGAVASKYANSEESHPFKRGNFILERLMCQPMGLPGNGGDVPAIKDHTGENKRDRYSAHVNDTSCAACHNLLDPIGYVWECYDGAGRYRTKEWHESKYGGPKTIDTSVTLKGILTFDESEAVPANSMRDLSEYVASSDRGPECMAMQYYRYVSGESKEEIDNNKVVRKIYEDFQTQGYDLQALFTNIVGLNSFVTRRGR